MNVSDFDFNLPSDLIAQMPPAERGTSRLLVLDRRTDAITHTAFHELPAMLLRGDLLVANDTRVFPARLIGHRVPSGGTVECLLLHRLDVLGPGSAQAEDWEALVHPGQKLRPGARVRFGTSPAVHAEVLERRFYGRRLMRLWTEDGRDLMEVIEEIGHVPLPPYIRRLDAPPDRERYQTIYARATGSVAAPTAGLHFTAPLLDALRIAGVDRTELTLHVGYGTFKPVRSERVEDHIVDPEPYLIGVDVAAAINQALDERRRIVAVGTTTTRALESAAAQGAGRVKSSESVADLFIYPGFNFRVTGALLTNFHLPRSSLLMLVSAFAGRERVLNAYREAIARKYRFYSYGDAMFIV
jgi:S-adenosylmethionine:tRNA ribosyltransferase-isomerase